MNSENTNLPEPERDPGTPIYDQLTGTYTARQSPSPTAAVAETAATEATVPTPVAPAKSSPPLRSRSCSGG